MGRPAKTAVLLEKSTIRRAATSTQLRLQYSMRFTRGTYFRIGRPAKTAVWSSRERLSYSEARRIDGGELTGRRR